MEIDATQAVTFDWDASSDEDDSPSSEIIGTLKVFERSDSIEVEKSFEISSGENGIGRGTDCKVHINNKALSKRHAVIEASSSSCCIYDDGSLNKSRKGKRVLKPHIRYDLEDGDELYFGNVRAKFYLAPSTNDSDEDSDSLIPIKTGLVEVESKATKTGKENEDSMPSITSRGNVEGFCSRNYSADDSDNTDVENSFLKRNEVHSNRKIPEKIEPGESGTRSKSSHQDDKLISCMPIPDGKDAPDFDAPTLPYNEDGGSSGESTDAEDSGCLDVNASMQPYHVVEKGVDFDASTQPYHIVEKEVDFNAPTQSYVEDDSLQNDGTLEKETVGNGDRDDFEEVDLNAPTQAISRENTDSSEMHCASTVVKELFTTVDEVKSWSERSSRIDSEEDVDFCAPTQPYSNSTERLEESCASTQTCRSLIHGKLKEKCQDIEEDGIDFCAPTQPYSNVTEEKKKLLQSFYNEDDTDNVDLCAPTQPYGNSSDLSMESEQLVNESRVVFDNEGSVDICAPTQPYDTSCEESMVDASNLCQNAFGDADLVTPTQRYTSEDGGKTNRENVPLEDFDSDHKQCPCSPENDSIMKTTLPAMSENDQNTSESNLSDTLNAKVLPLNDPKLSLGKNSVEPKKLLGKLFVSSEESVTSSDSLLCPSTPDNEFQRSLSVCETLALVLETPIALRRESFVAINSEEKETGVDEELSLERNSQNCSVFETSTPVLETLIATRRKSSVAVNSKENNEEPFIERKSRSQRIKERSVQTTSSIAVTKSEENLGSSSTRCFARKRPNSECVEKMPQKKSGKIVTPNRDLLRKDELKDAASSRTKSATNKTKRSLTGKRKNEINENMSVHVAVETNKKKRTVKELVNKEFTPFQLRRSTRRNASEVCNATSNQKTDVRKSNADENNIGVRYKRRVPDRGSANESSWEEAVPSRKNLVSRTNNAEPVDEPRTKTARTVATRKHPIPASKSTNELKDNLTVIDPVKALRVDGKNNTGVAVPGSSRRTSTSNKKMKGEKCCVMFTGIENEEELKKKVIKLGGEIVEDLGKCTHLVTDKFHRTVKFLCCVSKGTNIVNVQWLLDSYILKYFLDVETYILKDVVAEEKFSFCLKITLEKSRSNRLLNDWTLSATKSVLPPPEHLKEIISYAGGKFVTRLPKASRNKFVILGEANDRTSWASMVKRGYTVVSSEFLLTGLLQYSLDVDRYRIV